MSKIFITIPWFVPAFRAGGPIQSVANMVNELNDGNQYYIFTGDTDLNGAELENITTNQWVPYNENSTVWYASPEKRSESLVKQVDQIQPDVLFIIGMFSWHFNIVPLLYCKTARKILSTRGMLHPGALAQKKWKKKVYLGLLKMLDFHFKIDFHATDSEEAQYIRDYFGDTCRVYVAQNFPKNVGLLPLPPKEPGRLRLVSIALISPMKNILEVLQALGKITDRVDYSIYGPVKDEEYWDECKAAIKNLPPNVSVEYMKEIVPGMVKEALKDFHVFVLPSKSENFGHALYEALSAGRPLITSFNTPWKRLTESKAGFNVSGIGTDELENAIHFFSTMDQQTLELWSIKAAEYANEKVDFVEIRKSYEKMFEGETKPINTN